ncbi:hypothetical protein MBLNU459_g2015t1 [Dothideomycetes sp. NU459]
MTLAPADYQRLVPFGLESVSDCSVNLEIILESIQTLQNNKFITTATDTTHDLSSSPFFLLNSAKTHVDSLSSLPVNAFRSLSSYAKLIAALIPKSTDGNTLADALQAAADQFPVIDEGQVATTSKAATEALSTASGPVGTSALKAKRVKLLLKAAMLPSKPGAPGPPNQIEDVTFLSVIADCLEPVTGSLDLTDTAAQTKLFTLSGVVITPANLQKTFAQIKNANQAEALKIVQSWNTFESNLNAASSLFDQASFGVDTLVRALASSKIGMNNVSAEISRFRQSLDTSPDDYEKISQDVVAAWKIIDTNLQAFITLATQGLSSRVSIKLSKNAGRKMQHSAHHPYSVMALSANEMGAGTAPASSQEPTPSDVKDNFGPPSYIDTLLADLGPEAGKVNEALSSFLEIPYINALKVTTKNGEETDLRSQVLAIRQKYLALQARSIPIVRDISAYGLLSEALLPRVNQPGGVPLDTFLEQNTILVMRHGQKAKAIADETNQLKQEFQDILDMLQENLKEVLRQIETQEHALEEAEKEYKYEWITAMIDGILTLAFAGGAILALCLGAAPLAGKLAIDAGLTAYSMIVSAIKADGLAKVISNLRKSIEAAKESKTRLETVIPIFSNMVSMMQKIGGAWDLISTNLDEVQSVYTVWTNPKLFTPPYIELTMEAWENVRKGVQVYVDTVVGTKSPDAVKSNMVFAMAKTHIAKQNQSHDATRPPSYRADSVVSSTVKVASFEENDTKLAFRTLMATTSSDEVNAFFSAPTLRGHPVNPNDLQRLGSGWQEVAQSLQRVGLDDLASNCQGIASSIADYTLPATRQAVMKLLDFARKQPQVPTLPVSEADWQLFYNSRVQSLADGKTDTVFVDTNLRDLQTRAQNVYSFTQAKTSELEFQIEQIRRQEADLQAQRDSKQNMLSNILGGIFGSLFPIPGIDVITRAIAELTTAITNATSSRIEKTNQVQVLHNTINVLGSSRQQLGDMFKSSSDIALFWADMTTQTSTAADLWQPLSFMKELEIDLYKTTWNAVVTSFASWEQ